jgi:hypothetical protein
VSRARAAVIVALLVVAPACHSSSPPAETSAPAVAPATADLATARDAATAPSDLAVRRAAAPATRASGAAVTPTRAPAAPPALMPVGSIKDGTLRYNLPTPLPSAPPDAGVKHSSHDRK